MASPEIELDDSEWRERLTAAQYEVLRRSATEPAWSGELLHVDDNGVFHCAAVVPALLDRVEVRIRLGWPSFDRAVDDGTVLETTDSSHGMVRTEITVLAAAATSATSSRRRRHGPPLLRQLVGAHLRARGGSRVLGRSAAEARGPPVLLEDSSPQSAC